MRREGIIDVRNSERAVTRTNGGDEQRRHRAEGVLAEQKVRSSPVDDGHIQRLACRAFRAPTAHPVSLLAAPRFEISSTSPRGPPAE